MRGLLPMVTVWQLISLITIVLTTPRIMKRTGNYWAYRVIGVNSVYNSRTRARTLGMWAMILMFMFDGMAYAGLLLPFLSSISSSVAPAWSSLYRHLYQLWLDNTIGLACIHGIIYLRLLNTYKQSEATSLRGYNYEELQARYNLSGIEAGLLGLAGIGPKTWRPQRVRHWWSFVIGVPLVLVGLASVIGAGLIYAYVVVRTATTPTFNPTPRPFGQL